MQPSLHTAQYGNEHTYTQCTYTRTLGIPMNRATLTSEAHHMVYIVTRNRKEREGGRKRKERKKERERERE